MSIGEYNELEPFTADKVVHVYGGTLGRCEIFTRRSSESSLPPLIIAANERVTLTPFGVVLSKWNGHSLARVHLVTPKGWTTLAHAADGSRHIKIGGQLMQTMSCTPDSDKPGYEQQDEAPAWSHRVYQRFADQIGRGGGASSGS